MKIIQAVPVPKFDLSVLGEVWSNYIDGEDDEEAIKTYEGQHRAALSDICEKVRKGEASVWFYHYMNVTLQRVDDSLVIDMDQTDGPEVVDEVDLYTYVVLFCFLSGSEPKTHGLLGNEDLERIREGLRDSRAD